jgi:hypothetical protein
MASKTWKVAVTRLLDKKVVAYKIVAPNWLSAERQGLENAMQELGGEPDNYDVDSVEE